MVGDIVMPLPKMKKRKYTPGISLKVASYITYVKCFVCGKKIMAQEHYYDGGWGYRAHVGCVQEPRHVIKKEGI